MTAENKNDQESSSDLFFNFYRNGGIIVYPSSSEFSNRFLNLANNLSRRFRRTKLIVMPDTSVTDNDIKNFNFILLGFYHSNKILHKFGNTSL